MRSLAFLVGLAVVAGLGTFAVAGEVMPSKPIRVVDVALQEGGILLGQVVTPEGRPVAQAVVRVETDRQALGTVTTDEQGRFAIIGLNSGVYRLSAAGGTGTYRLWSPRTAPPGAQPVTLIVANEDISRGQAFPRVRQWIRNPWIVGGAIATAIAVPVAVAEHDEEPASP